MRIASLFTTYWLFALVVALISIPGQAALPATDGSGNPVPTLAPLIKKSACISERISQDRGNRDYTIQPVW